MIYLWNLLTRYFRLYQGYFRQRKYQKMNIEETFSDIYKRNRWGGNNREFYSGSGTMDDKIVGPYILKIEELAISERFFGRTFIDLGCGDFQVGKKIIPLCSKYIGIDIVKPLIRYNQNQYGNDVISFKHLTNISHFKKKI